MLRSRPPAPSALDAALKRFEAVAHKKREAAFAASRLPYPPDEENMNTIVPFPSTDLHGAAQAVVSNMTVARVWEPGTKITEPGLYEIPIEVYHSDICDGPSVSSSGLRTIYQQSLAHYWSDSYLNPDRDPYEPSAALILGSAAHHLLLGQADFDAKFIVRPTEAPDGKAWHGSNASCKKWNADARRSGKMILKPDALDQITAMARALSRNRLVSAGLLSGAVEKSIFWKDAETGIWLKARPDVIAGHGEIIADYKTTADASGDKCDRTLGDYGYHMQLALAGMGVEAVFGRRPGNDDYVLVYQETSAPYCVSVRPIDTQAISYGRMQIRQSIRKLAKALATRADLEANIASTTFATDEDLADARAQADADAFPGYENDTSSVSLTAWETKKLEEAIKGGLLDQAVA